MSSSLTCTNCGSSEIETDTSRGDTFCTKCGHVIDENCIVSEVQFEEGTHGASHIIGQRHDAEGPYKLFGGLSGVLGANRESRQVTLLNARRRIKTVCDQLRLNDHFVEMSFNFYKMALNRRLTHGRKHIHVIAACIYIACRTEGTSHMLLDLSDVAQVNVYELGRTYLKLTSALCITIPAIDPSLYVIRFAQHLELGDRTPSEIEKIRNSVIATANRLVQRMKRDWMHYGRRPSGLCGAALLIAARLQDVHCSIKDVIKIVKVCETTIRKRLFEFSETPTSGLTLDEFTTIDLEGEEDPPCYKMAKRKQKQMQQLEDQNHEDLENKVAELQKLIEKDLAKSRKKFRSPYAKYVKLVNEPSLQIGNVKNETDQVERIVLEETVHTIEAFLKGEGNGNDYNNYLDHLKSLRPTAASLGLGDSPVKDVLITDNRDNDEKDKDENEELDLEDIDDDELDAYILSTEEVKAKTIVWTKIHAEYLLEMKEKEERKAQEEKERKEKEALGEIQPRKKRKTKKKVQSQAANTAEEAIGRMLQEKKISNKINYDVLKSLTPGHISGTSGDKTTPVIHDRINDESMIDHSQTELNVRTNAIEDFSTPKTNNSPLKRLTTLKNSSSVTLSTLKEPLFSRIRAQREHDHRTTSISIANDDSNKQTEFNAMEKQTQQSTSTSKSSMRKHDREDDDDVDADDLEEEEEEEVLPKRKELSILALMNGEDNDDNDETLMMDNENYDYDYDDE